MLPFAGCLFSFSRLKPSKIELASGCQLHRIGIWLPLACCQFIRVSELILGRHLPVAYLTLVVLNHLKWNWHLAASCQLPIHKSKWINTWLPFACGLFSFSRLKPSKIELASGCQLPIHKSKWINTMLPFAGCLFCFSRLKPSKIELDLAASCQLPIHKSKWINTWLPFAGCLFSFSRLKPSKIELASGCQLPVANS